jgi:hypothetical protein
MEPPATPRPPKTPRAKKQPFDLNNLIDSKNITESSKKLYKANFVRLNDGQPVTNLKFLLDAEAIDEKLKQYKPNTQRNYIIAITSLLADLKNQDKRYNKPYKSYSHKLESMNADLKDATAKTPSEKTNWLTQNEVIERFEELRGVIDEIKNKKKITPETYDKLLDLVILGLFVLQKPRRNKDYQFSNIVKEYSEPVFGKEHNFLDLATKSFIFNNYKTAGTYKTQTQPISPDLLDIISLYLKFHPKKSELTNTSSIPFLVKSDGTELVQINDITRRLNKIFGKNVGSSMLRKIYLTGKYGGALETLKTMKTDASAMGTSPSTIENNYVKRDLCGPP